MSRRVTELNGKLVYSDTGVEIGTYMGKKLYRKVIKITIGNSGIIGDANGSQDITIPIDIPSDAQIIKVNGCVSVVNTPYAYPLPFLKENGFTSIHTVSSAEITIKIVNDTWGISNSREWIFIIYYAK